LESYSSESYSNENETIESEPIANETEYEPSGFCNYDINEAPIEVLKFFKMECENYICCNQLNFETAEKRTVAAYLIQELIDARQHMNQTERELLKSKLSEISV